MKRLRKKLHSQSGASILLALLLFLVCSMVAATVLAAAVSNAGKAKSNRVEHQRYLTLSSALELVCDELTQAKYTGKYKVWEWDVTTVTKDAEGKVISSRTDGYFHCQQQTGKYECDHLTNQIPLLPELDAIFNKEFAGKSGYGKVSGLRLENNPKVHPLTVTLPEDLPGYPDDGPAVYRVSRDVLVTVKLDHATKHISLTAQFRSGAMEQAEKYVLKAELVVKNPPVLNYSPAGRIGAASPTIPSAGLNQTVETKKNGVEYTTKEDMTWELNWIQKGAA